MQRNAGGITAEMNRILPDGIVYKKAGFADSVKRLTF